MREAPVLLSNLTDLFVQRLFELSTRPISTELSYRTRRLLLDYVGVTLAGSRMLHAKQKFLSARIAGAGKVQALGHSDCVDVQTAALINGFSAHVAELDDGVRFCSVHPGAPIISALLPIVEQDKLGIDSLLRGILVGYEAAIRLAMTIQPAHRHAGYHATGTCGTVGAAVAVAVALNYDKQTLKNSLCTAICGTAGLLKVLEGRSELKPYNAAHAASEGLVAAMIAGAGFNTPDEVLAGPRGMLAMMAGQSDTQYLVKGFDGGLCIDLVYVKPYAACRHSHAPIAAALELLAKYSFRIADIVEVRVNTYFLAADGHSHTHVEGASSAKMSTPYSVAVALISGKAGIDQFSQEAVTDVEVLKLAHKVRVSSDPTLDALVPYKRAAEVEIEFVNGSLISTRVDLPKGEPELPLSDAELDEKFLQLAIYAGKTSSQSKTIRDAIRNSSDCVSILNSLR